MLFLLICAIFGSNFSNLKKKKTKKNNPQKIRANPKNEIILRNQNFKKKIKKIYNSLSFAN